MCVSKHWDAETAQCGLDILVPRSPVSFGHVVGKTGGAARQRHLGRVALGTRMSSKGICYKVVLPRKRRLLLSSRNFEITVY